jgi:hypothetical protein
MAKPESPTLPTAASVPNKIVRPDPTVSSDDPRLYEYANRTEGGKIVSDAPDDVIVNIGTTSVMVAAPHAVNDPQRVEVGDRRRGAYYLTVLGKLPGMMRFRDVDPTRLDAVNKIRDIRIGKREDDWIVAARKKSAEQGGKQPNPYNPHATESPLARAARGV